MPTFLLLAHERSGSTWLMHGLAPVCLHEIWQVNRRQYRYGDPLKEPVHYLKNTFAANPGYRGCKLLMYRQLPIAKAPELLAFIDRVILLGRLNLTEAAISIWMARRFNDWQQQRVRPPIDKIAPQVVNIGEVRGWLRRFVSDRREWTTAITNSGVPVLRLWYDGIGIEHVNAARAFVDLPPIDHVDSAFVVQRDEAFYLRAIANYDQINHEFGKRYGILFGPSGDWWRSNDYPPTL